MTLNFSLLKETVFCILIFIVLLAGGCRHTAEQPQPLSEVSGAQNQNSSNGQSDFSGSQRKDTQNVSTPDNDEETQPDGYKASSIQSMYDLVSGSLKGCRPLKNRGRIIGWIQDINSDGSDDGAIICLDGDSSTDELENLARDIRIYDDDYDAVSFSVVWFTSALDRDGHVSFRQHSVPLGAYRSLRRVSELNLKDPLPFGVELQMFDDTRSVRIWLLFKDGISVLHLLESPKHGVEITDIDQDGIIDIITSERFFEEGAGEETFLSWHKWNGKTFVEYSSTNVVRNLNSFLSQVSYYIEHNNWNRFYRFALSNYMQRKVSPGGTEKERLFRLFFRPSRNSPEAAVSGIRNIRFQEVLENPFSENSRQIEISCKITTEQEYFYTVIVQQSRNPFIQPQFFLQPVKSF